MPRPHALPRRPPAPNSHPFPALDLSPPPVRPLTVVNVQRGHKAMFDSWQSWLSYREGRSVQQCEAFAALLDVAKNADDPRLAGFDGFGQSQP